MCLIGQGGQEPHPRTQIHSLFLPSLSRRRKNHSAALPTLSSGSPLHAAARSRVVRRCTTSRKEEGVILNRLEKAVPLELQAFPRWVTWRLVDGKKLPMTVDGKPASVTDCTTWATFERVQQASPRGFGGLGFVFTETPFLGIDIDDCLDGGDMERRAMEVARFCKTYTERSPSGHGLHLIGRGKAIFPGGGSSDGRKKSGGLGFSSFEVYNWRRFFTITGDIVQPFDTIGELDRGTRSAGVGRCATCGAADSTEHGAGGNLIPFLLPRR